MSVPQTLPPPNASAHEPSQNISLEKYFTQMHVNYTNAHAVVHEYEAIARVAEKMRLDELHADLLNAIERRFTEKDAAIEKAALATEKRFEGVNEFRAALTDSNARYAVREVVNAKVEAVQSEIDIKVQSLQTGMNANTQAISNLRTLVATLAAVLGFVLTLVQIGLHFMSK